MSKTVIRNITAEHYRNCSPKHKQFKYSQTIGEILEFIALELQKNTITKITIDISE